MINVLTYMIIMILFIVFGSFVIDNMKKYFGKNYEG